jgi:hypothetical protein
MPSLQCECGARIDLSPIPNPMGFSILWEPRIDALVDRLIEAHNLAQSDAQYRKQVSAALHLSEFVEPQAYECRNCGRLALMRKASDQQVSGWYLPESGDRLGSIVQPDHS